MNLEDIAKQSKDLPSWKLEREFNDYFVRNQERFRHLDENNRQIILDLINKYRQKAMHGVRPNSLTLQREFHRLWRNRFELGLKENDLDFIKEVITWFGQKD